MAGTVQHGAGGEHAHGAEAVGNSADEGLRGAPDDHLDRQRQREYLAAPAEGRRHRRQEQAERGARSEAERADQAAANQDDERRAPADGLHRLVRC
jgi:hypothetical protein